MAHLLNIWPSVSSRLLKSDRILLLFDYDGTLTPIVPRPEDATLSEETRRRLTSLAANPRCIAGIVSGRSIADLSLLADIPGFIYAGNHGMEIQGQGIDFIHPGAVAARDALDRVRDDLAGALAHVPGIIVEHKGLTLTVHFRGTPEPMAGGVNAVVEEATAPLVEQGLMRLTRGKMVVEVRPAIPWDKGKAIEKIREEFEDSPLPVYFGDDRTDEDGFTVVQDMGGVAVFVGDSRQGTVALHQLDSPDEVSETMRLLLDVL